MKVLRERSFLFKKHNMHAIVNQPQFLQTISRKADDLIELWKDENTPMCMEVYKKLKRIGLFELPKRIDDVLSDKTEVSEKIIALREGLNVPFSELINYWEYINDNTQFSTHQGIKGLEFDRVSVIMDDENAGGFLFSCEKLFGSKSLTDTDWKNQAEGKDSSITRTMRLFYVTCTRAKESLALIAYTSDIEAVKKTARSNGWFTEDEIVLFVNDFD